MWYKMIYLDLFANYIHIISHHQFPLVDSFDLDHSSSDIICTTGQLLVLPGQSEGQLDPQ